MQLNQISQLLQPKVGQIKSDIDNSSGNKAFELILKEMMHSTGSQDASNTLGLDSVNSINSTNLINGVNGTDLTSGVNVADKTGFNNKIVNGLDSLSLNPQRMSQMLEIMQISAKNSAMTNFGSDDSSGADSGSDISSGGLDVIGNSNPMSGKDDMSKLLQTVLQNIETSSSHTKNSNNFNAQIQQLAASMKLQD